MAQHDAVRVVGLCGSLRPTSWTRAALQLALAGAHEKGAATELLDLRDFELSFCTGEEKEPDRRNAGVERLQQSIMQAHGIILATPNYHGTLSGVLKNALDLMSMREFERKVVGLVGVSGGRTGATSTLNTLRAIGRSLHAWVIPWEAWVYNADAAFAADGSLRDDATAQRLKEVGRRVARLTHMLASKEAQELLQLWEDDGNDEG
jgi:NAD(P)H-dependent FMN reductase